MENKKTMLFIFSSLLAFQTIFSSETENQLLLPDTTVAVKEEIDLIAEAASASDASAQKEDSSIEQTTTKKRRTKSQYFQLVWKKCKANWIPLTGLTAGLIGLVVFKEQLLELLTGKAVSSNVTTNAPTTASQTPATPAPAEPKDLADAKEEIARLRSNYEALLEADDVDKAKYEDKIAELEENRKLLENNLSALQRLGALSVQAEMTEKEATMALNRIQKEQKLLRQQLFQANQSQTNVSAANNASAANEGAGSATPGEATPSAQPSPAEGAAANKP